MSRLFGIPPAKLAGFPRVSGDEPVRRLLWQAAATFSPRERG